MFGSFELSVTLSAATKSFANECPSVIEKIQEIWCVINMKNREALVKKIAMELQLRGE